jgi:hypothetical protein
MLASVTPGYRRGLGRVNEMLPHSGVGCCGLARGGAASAAIDSSLTRMVSVREGDRRMNFPFEGQWRERSYATSRSSLSTAIAPFALCVGRE